MKSISDLEKRQQKFIGGMMRELSNKLKAQARAGAKAGPESMSPSISNIMDLDNQPYREAYKKGGKAKKKKKSRVNEAGNYTKPTMRKRLFEKIKAGSKGGKPGQWSARKAQMLAKQYKEKGGGYK